MPEEKKERIQLEFSETAMKRIDEVKELSGATTRAELFRSAIRLYSWLVAETTSESVITITENGQVTSLFKVSLLLDTARK